MIKVNVVAEDKENQIIGDDHVKVKKNTFSRIKRSVLGDLPINIRKAKRKIFKGKTPEPAVISSNAPDNKKQTNICTSIKEEPSPKIHSDEVPNDKLLGIKPNITVKVSFKQRQAKIKRKRSSIFVASKNVKRKVNGQENPGFDAENLPEVDEVKQENVYEVKRENIYEVKRDDSSTTEKGPQSHIKSLIRKVSKLHISDPPNEAYEIFSDYANDIYSYLRKLEVLHQPEYSYMEKQHNINVSLRTTLIEWLAEITLVYHLQTETLYLAVSYLNRFLSTVKVTSDELPLVGIAAMFIAAKFQEVSAPRVRDWIQMSDEAYTKNDILQAEWFILKTLTCDIVTPTPFAFLAHYCTDVSKNVKYLAMYLCELSLFEIYPYLKFLPSYLAAAAVALAQHTLEEEIWPRKLILQSGYRLKDLKFGICCLAKTFKDASNHPQKVTQQKYESKEYGYVSHLTPRDGSIFDWF